MADVPDDSLPLVKRYYGAWKGVNEWPGECEEGEFEALWNADCRGDIIVTRGGRQLETTLNTVAPRSVICSDHTSVTDRTAVAVDGDQATGFSDFAPGAVDIQVGFPHPVSNLQVTLSAFNALAATMIVKYVSSGSALTNVSGLADGTAAAGKTLAQSGAVTWTLPTDWKPTTPPYSGSTETLYWIVLSFSAALTGTTKITELRTTLSGGLSGVPNGAYHWRRRTGERFLVVGLDDQANGIARLYVYDRSLQTLKPFSIPGEVAKSGPDARWVFAAVNSSLIAANGYCFLYSDPKDPFSMKPFLPVAMKSASSRETRAPTEVTALAVFEGRLAVVQRQSPNLVELSDPIGASFDIDDFTNAPLGGMNVWDVTNNFDCIDPGGGKVNACISQGQRLLILTPTSTHSWDGYAHRVIDPNVGCVAPDSVRSVESSVFFLGEKEIYVNRGGKNEGIAWRVHPTLQACNWLSASKAIGEIYHELNQYRLAMPRGSDEKNSMVFVYDFKRDIWSLYGTPPSRPIYYVDDGAAETWNLPYQVAAMVSCRDEEWGEELLTVDYSGNLYLENSGEFDGALNGQLVVAYVVSHRIKWEDQGVSLCRNVRVERRGIGTSFSVGLVVDGKPAAVSDDSFILGTLDTLDSRYAGANQTYDSAQFGVDKWVGRRFESTRVSFGRDGGWFQIVITAGGTTGDADPVPLEIRGFEVEFDPMTGRR